MALSQPKFIRAYKLFVEAPPVSSSLPNVLPDLTFQNPTTIEFDITRNTLSSANVCQVRLYNLSQNHREQLFFNNYQISSFRKIRLQIGYGTGPVINYATVFEGNVSQCWSYREGVNFITTIECFDSGFAFVNSANQTASSITFPAGTPMAQVITTLMKQLPNVTAGAISPKYAAAPPLSRSTTYSGSITSILYDLTAGGFYIDRGVAYAMDSENFIVTAGATALITADTGLLGTPVRYQNTCRFEMLLEPSLQVGTLVTIASLTNPKINGVYKVTAVKHRGMISDAVCGDATTEGEFNFFKVVTPAVPVS